MMKKGECMFFKFFKCFVIFMGFLTNEKTQKQNGKNQKDKTRNKREGKRDLPVSNLRREVLGPLLCRWCCPGTSGRLLSYPGMAILTDLRKREAQDMGQQRGLERIR